MTLLDDESPVAGELDRLARALNHEPQVLAQLIQGMLGARELWLPKLLDSSDRDVLRAEIDGLLKHALEGELRAVAATLSAIDWQSVLRNLPGGGRRRRTGESGRTRSRNCGNCRRRLRAACRNGRRLPNCC